MFQLKVFQVNKKPNFAPPKGEKRIFPNVYLAGRSFTFIAPALYHSADLKVSVRTSQINPNFLLLFQALLFSNRKILTFSNTSSLPQLDKNHSVSFCLCAKLSMNDAESSRLKLKTFIKLLKIPNICTNLRQISRTPCRWQTEPFLCKFKKTFFNIKYYLYHVHHNPKHYRIIFAIILRFDKVMFCECQFSRE